MCINKFRTTIFLWLSKAIKAVKNAVLNCLRFILWGRKPGGSVNHICVHRVGQIGDMICAVPAIYALRFGYPNAKITLFTSTGGKNESVLKDLWELFPWINNIIQYSTHNSTHYTPLLKRLRAESIDMWIALPQDLTSLWVEARNMIFARMVSKNYGFGFSVNTTKFFRKAQEEHGHFDHESQRLVKIIGQITNTEIEAPYVLPYVDELLPTIMSNCTKTKGYLTQNYYQKRVMSIIPGSNREMNKWSIDNFVEIARRWIECDGYVLILGGPNEQALQSHFDALPSQSLNFLCGSCSLLESTILLYNSAVVVGNDTGPMHIAAMLGRPTVSIFSARDFPTKWFPLSQRGSVHRHQTSCSPCFGQRCFSNDLCLKGISVDDVWQSVVRLGSISG